MATKLLMLLLINIPLLYLIKTSISESAKVVYTSIFKLYFLFFSILLFENWVTHLTINFQWWIVKSIAISFIILTLSRTAIKNPLKVVNKKKIGLIILASLIYGLLVNLLIKALGEISGNSLFIIPSHLVVSIFFLVIVAPIVEEFYFREYLYKLILENKSNRLYLIISVISFGSVHLFFQGVGSLIWILPLGLILGLIRIYNGNILGCIIFHSIYNLLAITILSIN
jgi:membrane protease YdiL (CAAX protease family)